jgi:hypothetical protein
MRKIGIAGWFILMAAHGAAARLSPSADLEFTRYVASQETRLVQQHAIPVVRQPAIEPVNGGARALSGALLHHWRAAALVPHATPKDMLALLRDYNHFSKFYSPQIVSSRALKDDGATATLAMRFKEQKVITVVFDAEYQVESNLGVDSGYSFSRSTHIWQVDNAGSARERRRTEGDDDGFLWRLNSYWSFASTAEGLLIQCEAVSLTRDIPLGLGWLLAPIVRDLPREMLEFTLDSTQKALKEAHR